jgi:hypothetical protein
MRVLDLIVALTLTGCGTYYVDVDTDGGETDGERAVRETSITSNVDTDTPADLTDWIYVPSRATYHETVQLSPKGYRLPTRAEAIAALESGDLVGSDTVWTASYLDREQVWVMNLITERLTPAFVDQLYEAAYVKVK